MATKLQEEQDPLAKGYMEVVPEVFRDILRHVITHLNPLHTPCGLGEPGCGKTEITEQVIRECKKEGVFPPSLSLQDAVDMRGLPVHDHDNKRTQWYPPAWLPNEPFDGVIFIDEAPQGSYDTLKPLGQLITARKIDEYYLPVKARWILAGNRRTDSAGAAKLPTPVINRIAMIGVAPSPDSWSKYMTGVSNEIEDKQTINKITKRVTSPEFYAGPGCTSPIVLSYFTKFRRAQFSTFDPTKQSPFASARSITRLSEFIDSSPPDDIVAPYICGLVGNAVGLEFIGYMNTYASVPDFEEVAADYKKFPVPAQNNPALQCAISSAAIDWCTLRKQAEVGKNKYEEKYYTTPAKKVDAIISWMTKFPAEYAAYFMDSVSDLRPGTMEYNAYMKEFRPKHFAALKASKI